MNESAIISRSYARCGLLGNPSDGYNGKCISFALTNFWAEVMLTPSTSIVFKPNPIHDSTEYKDLTDFKNTVDGCGYYGGIRLLQAMTKVFFEYILLHKIDLPPKNFTMEYSTTIPRQAGMSGSSAICCAALSCLLKYYNIEDTVLPLKLRPNLILEAEKNLGITAGLQDRVIQVYGGLVFMDFNELQMRERGHGDYQRMETRLLELGFGSNPFYIMYANNPSESGKVHANVRQRWNDGDMEVRLAMEEVAECALLGKEALEAGDAAKLAQLINRNFDLRRKMFGDEVLGSQNLQMIEVARSVGCAAKFTGSGGAVLVFCPGGKDQISSLQTTCKSLGFTLIQVKLQQGNSCEV